MKLDFNDILITPAVTTNVFSRKTIDPFHDGFLPLFTAPMDTVVDLNNSNIFKEHKINVCLPRGISHTSNEFTTFAALSLKEFDAYYLGKARPISSYVEYVLIDIANGHMSSLIESVNIAKSIHGDKLFLMVGNIANPETFRLLSLAGADAIRVGIGNGGGCFTKETKILTKKGYINIENVNIGDFVLTHRGKYKKVINTINYQANKILKINNILCTPNHEFYVINKIDANEVNEDNYIKFAFWIEAENLDENKHLLLEIDE
jgi:hypothetical protein